jgi:hypothetical protein
MAVSGQRCGGLEALSAAYKEDRIKKIVLWNSGVIDGSKRKYLADIKVPAAYFIGGPKDIAYVNVRFPTTPIQDFLLIIDPLG